jgi:hypothetical protein
MTPTRRTIEFAPAAYSAPPSVREEARARLQELADDLAAIPAESVFWESMRVSRLCLVVRAWSFLYSFEEVTVRVNDVRGKSR